MRRTFALVGAGALLGAVAAYFAHDWDGPGRAAPVVERAAAEIGEPALRTVDFLTLAITAGNMTEREALFRFAAGADRRTVEALAAQVAALPNIEGRRYALEALFTRYAEIDAPAAVAFARGMELPVATLVPLFTAWARNDAGGALLALGAFDPGSATTLGVALLEVLGNDASGVARVLAAAPRVDGDRFRIEAAVARAATDPDAALDALLELPPAKTGMAFERLAVIWAEKDVHGALAAAAQIGRESTRNELEAAVMRVWARLDPDALVDYVLDLNPARRDQMLSAGALQAFALADPQRTLQAAEGISGELGAMMRRAALVTLAREDPLAALSAVEALPNGIEREQMLSAIATTYGQTNPEAALAWAQSLNPPSANAVANVLAGLARVDPDRAIDMLFETMEATNQRSSGPLLALVGSGALSAEHTARVAERLLAAPARGPALQMLTQMWAQRQPHDATRWLLAKGSAAPRTALAHAGMHLGRTDPSAAIGYVDDVPPELRPEWISSVADGYAQSDPRAAAAWIAQYRGAPGYDAGVAAVASRTASSDPPAAARLFNSVNVAEAPDAPQAAQRIAAVWARQEHRAAAAWAGAIANEGARTAAVGAVAGQWAATDAVGARGWALGLPTGAARDAALAQVLGTATTTAIDHGLLDAFSSAEAREQAISNTVRIIAARDPAAARQLADQYLTDAGARRSAERFIEQGGSGPPLAPSPPRLPPGR